MTQPRLLADFAAVPTPRERRHARATNRAAQSSMFDDPATWGDDPAACDVCGSTIHATERCPHGTPLALALDTHTDRQETTS